MKAVNKNIASEDGHLDIDFIFLSPFYPGSRSDTVFTLGNSYDGRNERISVLGNPQFPYRNICIFTQGLTDRSVFTISLLG